MADVGGFFAQPGIFRELDIIGRYGGDEFMFILPECNEKNALIPLGKLKETINNREFNVGSKQTARITVSIGIAEFKRGDSDIFKVIDRADEALYYAKKHGRDRIILSVDTRQDG